jgi:hypothetical protein
LARKPSSCTEENWWIKDVYRLHRPYQALSKGWFPSSLHRSGRGLHGWQHSTLLPRLQLKISLDSTELQRQRQNSVHNAPQHLLLQGHDFGLKNAGETYQKAIQKFLKSQIGTNVKAYIDDVVVKNTEEDQLIADLTETFTNLQEFQWKVNPTNCVFGVPSGVGAEYGPDTNQ